MNGLEYCLLGGGVTSVVSLIVYGLNRLAQKRRSDPGLSDTTAEYVKEKYGINVKEMTPREAETAIGVAIADRAFNQNPIPLKMKPPKGS